MVFDNDKAYELYVDGNQSIAEMVEKSDELKDPKKYDRIRQSIESIASRVFPGSSIDIHFFGSRMMGVATDESDLDIYVEVDGGFHSPYATKSNHSLHVSRFRALAEALEESESWIVEEKLLNTTVPIIICDFKLRPRNISPRMSCDISLTNGISVRNTELFAKMFEVLPESINFLLFTKRWIKVLGGDCLKLKGYTITLMFVFFMQSNNFMPACQDLQEDVQEEIIDGYEVQVNKYYDDGPRSTGFWSYVDFVKIFFRFYSKFDFDQVISTSDGKCYSQRKYKKMYPEFLMRGILIAGPLKRGYNCGAMKSYQKNKFVEFCKDTVEFFDNHDL